MKQKCWITRFYSSKLYWENYADHHHRLIKPPHLLNCETYKYITKENQYLFPMEMREITNSLWLPCGRLINVWVVPYSSFHVSKETVFIIHWNKAFIILLSHHPLPNVVLKARGKRFQHIRYISVTVVKLRWAMWWNKQLIFWFQNWMMLQMKNVIKHSKMLGIYVFFINKTMQQNPFATSDLIKIST